MWMRLPGARGARRLAVRDGAASGFTLLEVLVVTAVVGVLVGLLSPGLARSRAAAKGVTCLANLRGLQLATRIYADAHRTLPLTAMTAPIPVLELPVKAWRCPEDKDGHSVPLTVNTYSAYHYLAPLYMDPPPGPMVLSRLKPKNGLRKYENNPMLPLFWDSGDDHDNDRNVVYWHGGAERRRWE